MENLDNELKIFKQNAENLEGENFEKFEDFESAYCAVINRGTELRNYIVNNPGICDENSLLVLTNRSTDFSLLDEKFKCLYSIIDLTKKLLERYKQQVKEYMETEKYQDAVNIYNQMFKFTRNYFYLLDIGDIYIDKFDNKEKCLEIYKEAEPYLKMHYRFLWKFAKIYKIIGEYYKSLLYTQKAIELELADIDSKKEVKDV